MSRVQPAWGVATRSGWTLLAGLAIMVGVYSMRYGLPHVPRPLLTNFVTHRVALSIHAVSASVALMAGPWQFLPKLRARQPGLHRKLGRLYVAAVGIGWLASIPVGLHAETGGIASAGFLTLGVCWVATTGMALARVLGGEIQSHRQWMIRSYALTAAAITLRLYIGTALALKVPFATAYPAIAWLCWVPNLALAEFLLRRPARGMAAPRAFMVPQEATFGASGIDSKESKHA